MTSNGRSKKVRTDRKYATVSNDSLMLHEGLGLKTSSTTWFATIGQTSTEGFRREALTSIFLQGMPFSSRTVRDAEWLLSHNSRSFSLDFATVNHSATDVEDFVSAIKTGLVKFGI